MSMTAMIDQGQLAAALRNTVSTTPAANPAKYETKELAEYTFVKRLGEGTYGKVDLVIHNSSSTKIALKSVFRRCTTAKEFHREFKYSYLLSSHPHIVTTYDVMFETRAAFVYAQEYAPLGDLFEAIPPRRGLPERSCKSFGRQIASALSYMHGKGLVHRDVKPENILLFNLEGGVKVKLTDFGMTAKIGSTVRKITGSIPYTPPEVCAAMYNDNISIETGSDVWSFAVLLFCMLTGNFPWENAMPVDEYFEEFIPWLKRKTDIVPSQWVRFTPRVLRLFRKMLNVNPSKRSSVVELEKYMDITWMRSNLIDHDEDPSNNKDANSKSSSSTSPNQHQSPVHYQQGQNYPPQQPSPPPHDAMQLHQYQDQTNNNSINAKNTPTTGCNGTCSNNNGTNSRQTTPQSRDMKSTGPEFSCTTTDSEVDNLTSLIENQNLMTPSSLRGERQRRTNEWVMQCNTEGLTEL